VRLGFWISPRYGPFSLGARFETYEPFISSTTDTESVDMGAHPYIYIQGDQKISVHLITIQKVTSKVQSVPHQSPDIY
jgi:hypothetical protein